MSRKPWKDADFDFASYSRKTVEEIYSKTSRRCLILLFMRLVSEFESAYKMTNHPAVVILLKEAGRGWIEHRTQRLAAALAFYTMLALAPLAIIAISVAGYFLGEDAARAGIVAQIEHLVSKNAALGIEGLIDKASEPEQSRTTAAISIGLLLFSGTAVFVELKDSLDTV